MLLIVAKLKESLSVFNWEWGGGGEFLVAWSGNAACAEQTSRTRVCVSVKCEPTA
jgi:hypothetical protein